MTDITLPRAELQQALDALKSSDESGCDEFLAIIDALEERLAQPEQEPVPGVVMRYGFPTLLPDRDIKSTDVRLYTTPPQRKPLTKEEMFEAIRPLYYSEKDARGAVDISEDEYRAIEAAHGIKGDV